MGLLRLIIRVLSAPYRSAPEALPRRIVLRSETVVVVRRQSAPMAQGTVLRGRCWVVDGDTIVIGNDRIRLAGIDAPELDHPWGQKAKWAMVDLCRNQIVRAEVVGELSYNRHVAICYLPDGRDLAAELVKLGLAIDWPKYSGGRYRQFEQPDIRRRHWRADARQRGLMPPQ